MGVKIQYYPISSKFDMWVDNDVPNWFPTLNNFYRSPFSKWQPQYRKYSTLSDFNDISYVGRIWCPEMIPDIEKFLPVAIFKMVTSRNFSMLGINSGHHYLPTYKILMISDNVEFLPSIFYAMFWQAFWKWQTSR